MKEICRLIGSIVLLLAVAIFALFKLNNMGFISGALGTWTTGVVEHVIGIKDDTVDLFREKGWAKATASPAFSGTTGSASGVSADIKEFWDGYESFAEEYVTFMQEYLKNPSDTAMISKLSSYASGLAELEKKASAYTGSTSLSEADRTYSLEASARVLAKLATVK